MIALQIEDLHYHYRSDWTGFRKEVLKGISLEVQEGETFGFLGQNGAGKTTTIKSILSLIHPTKGSIKVFGEDFRLTSTRKLIGYLPEQPYFYDHLTVWETLVLFGTLSGVESKFLPARISDLLEALGINDRKNFRMRSLSKGLTQRVGLAQAIIAKPKLLILDEPFSGLDPLGRADFKSILLDLKNSGTTIFMSSHVLSDVEYLCDRVSIMALGQLRGLFSISEIPIYSGAKYELVIKDCPDSETFVGQMKRDPQTFEIARDERRGLFTIQCSKEDQAKELLGKALSAGQAIQSYGFRHGSLEDLFVQMVKTAEQQESKGQISQ